MGRHFKFDCSKNKEGTDCQPRPLGKLSPAFIFLAPLYISAAGTVTLLLWRYGNHVRESIYHVTVCGIYEDSMLRRFGAAAAAAGDSPPSHLHVDHILSPVNQHLRVSPVVSLFQPGAVARPHGLPTPRCLGSPVSFWLLQKGVVIHRIHARTHRYVVSCVIACRRSFRPPCVLVSCSRM